MLWARHIIEQFHIYIYIYARARLVCEQFHMYMSLISSHNDTRSKCHKLIGTQCSSGKPLCGNNYGCLIRDFDLSNPFCAVFNCNEVTFNFNRNHEPVCLVLGRWPTYFDIKLAWLVSIKDNLVSNWRHALPYARMHMSRNLAEMNEMCII